MTETGDDDHSAEHEHYRRELHRVRSAIRTRQWSGAVQMVGDRTVIELLDEPTYDEWGTMTLGEWGGWLVQILPMIYNDRLVLSPKFSPMTYDHGWCYPKGPAAMLAALVWDPEAFGEPQGYIKRVGPPRAAGDRAHDGSLELLMALAREDLN